MPKFTFEEWREILKKHAFEIIVERNLSYELYKRLDNSEEGPLLYLNPVGSDTGFNDKGGEVVKQYFKGYEHEVKELLERELTLLGRVVHTIVVKQDTGTIDIRCPSCRRECSSFLQADDPVIEDRTWGADCPHCGPFSFKVKKDL